MVWTFEFLSFGLKKGVTTGLSTQQPSKEKVLKFNMTFFMILLNIFFSKHQNKAEFKDLDHPEVFCSYFPVLRISASEAAQAS